MLYGDVYVPDDFYHLAEEQRRETIEKLSQTGKYWMWGFGTHGSFFHYFLLRFFVRSN